MPGLSVKTKPLVAKTKAYPADVGTTVKTLESTGNPSMAAVANALRSHQSNLDAINRTLRDSNPDVTEIVVRDSSGKVVGVIGDFEFAGVVTRNYFSELHIGDPLGTGNPADAVINVNANGQITVGSTGWVDVIDPYGASAAWVGTQFDTLAVTGAADNGSGLIRLLVVGHTFVTGDAAIVVNVGGVPNAQGTFTVTNIDATHVDLQASVFTGTYTSGGTITRLLHVTGAVNNGAGLIRLTVTAHGYESGDKVNVASVGGVSNATGQWIITVITANTFDLRASTFAGAYTSGGLAIRYFAGGLFQTIAIGPSFAGYKLRAFPDGTLKINGATIVLSGTNAVITLDPTVGQIIIDGTPSGAGITTYDASGVLMANGTLQAQFNPGELYVGTPAYAQGYFKFSSSGSGGYTLLVFSKNGSGGNVLALDNNGKLGVNAAASPAYTIDAGGDINASGVFRKAGTAGIGASRTRGTGLTVNSDATGLKGTPGVGQSNITVVTSVTLTTSTDTFSGGILTA